MALSTRTAVRTAAALALPVALAILVVACGGGSGSDEAEGAATETDTPTTVEVEGQESATESTDADDGETAEETTTTVAPEPTVPEIEPVVYNGDFGTSVKPIFEATCASCHSPGGPGTGHWTLETVDDIVQNHEVLALIIEGGAMPPWPAGGESPPFHEDRSLRPDQVNAILEWSAEGGPLDVSADTPIEPANGVVGLADPDRVLTAPQPYAGSVEVHDDYRCQIYDPQLPDGGWITGYEFIPDQTEVVHHAIGYMVPGSARETAEARDGEDGKPGWQCYGSSGLGADDIFIGWAPGQLPTIMPEGSGLWVDPGAFIVIQIHYHYETAAPEDLSALAIDIADADDIAAAGGELDTIAVSEYVAPAEIPCSTEEEGPLCDRDTALAAAIERYGREGVRADAFLALCRAEVEDFAAMTDGRAWSSCDIPVAFVGGTGEIISVLGHEHEIGEWFKMTLNPGQPDEKVLLDIPDWDFDWQYNYRPVERIVLDNDDVVRIECGWDRARRDPDLEPAYVLWADGTDDEMCFATISTRPIS